MKAWYWLLAACAVEGVAAERTTWGLEPSVQARTVYDTNPAAAGGAAATAIGAADTWSAALGATLGLVSPATAPATGRLAYTAEIARFEAWKSEDYASHRLAGTSQLVAADWRLTAEGSALLVDGGHEGLPSTSAINANALAVWRERRAQWQYRGKVAAQRPVGAWRLRLSGTWLKHDFAVWELPGRTSFADRSDWLGGADWGRTTPGGALWFAGLRVGAQEQAQLLAPAGKYDYSSRAVRPVLGWEGRLGASSTVAFAAGPDFRRYGEGIDRRVFSRRDHTWLWFEGSCVTRLGRDWTLTGKTLRWAWLSSTGKSACTDFGVEAALAWAMTPATAVRMTAKAHQLAYFPSVRNDWEALGGLGVTRRLGARTQLSFEVQLHEGRNAFDDLPEREFSRAVVTLAGAIQL